MGNLEKWMQECEQAVQGAFLLAHEVAKQNQQKVLNAFWTERVSSIDLQGSSGYGLDDEGRDKLERIWAHVFDTEAALVRPQIISGTHALRLGLFAVCRPGDEILFATGSPYDTLEAVVGLRAAIGSLAEWGIHCKIVDLNAQGKIDIPAVQMAIGKQTKVVMFQRSRGYRDRPALNIHDLSQAFQKIKEKTPHVWIGVDNCYGEFVECQEPTSVGADFVMGSLIKNPGAGLASTGGYVVGKKEIVEQAAAQLTAPGIGREGGPTHQFLQSFYQSFFLAPHVVMQAVKTSILASYVFEHLGLDVSPKWDEPRTDIIVATVFKSRERLLTFCRAVQSVAPIDSFVMPHAAPMAGYENQVVMAAGAFVQGASLELSADGPMREPYIGYLQGGLTYEHGYIAIENIARQMLNLQEK